MITSVVPITPEGLHFFHIALDILIIEVYGQTESTETATSTPATDLSSGTTRSPLASIDLQRLAEEYKFKYYECIKNIHYHSDLFSEENNLVISTLKTCRKKARQYFQTIIQSLYNLDEINTK
ncbi:unnamed protein product [Rotaria sordida]|uniref:Uncharacterized protein n=1 Tax=Rotaria sordida TaxID=392033 RepID=A0A815EBT7_9BILA|nr:unnamed protein product [Rotaria sordida]